MILKKGLKFLGRAVFLFGTKPLQFFLTYKLSGKKGQQKKDFYRLRGKFPALYNNLKKDDISKFTTPLWNNFNTKLEKVLFPRVPFSFLTKSLILYTMFLFHSRGLMKDELNFLEKKISKDELKKILEEDYVGNPILLNAHYLTSYNTIHHLYSFVKFFDQTEVNLDNINTIVEWGGGYGNMAKIFRRLKGSFGTYIIIDTPLLSCVQWLYLSVIFGENNINFIQGINDSIQAGKINILPLSMMGRFDINADLFISTWALNESNKYSQDYVFGKNWFHAPRLLLAYQDSGANLPDSGRVGELLKNAGANIEEIKFWPGNYYAFR